MSDQMTPRRVRGSEEAELLAAVTDVARTRGDLEAALARRDRLIAELLHDQARPADICEITGLSPQAVYKAARRAHGR